MHTNINISYIVVIIILIITAFNVWILCIAAKRHTVKSWRRDELSVVVVVVVVGKAPSGIYRPVRFNVHSEINVQSEIYSVPGPGVSEF